MDVRHARSAPFSTAVALSRLPPALRPGVARRLRQLEDELQDEYGLRLRDDSRFAFAHCTGESGEDRATVLAEMATMQWLCDRTDYTQLCQLVMRRVAEQAREVYGVTDWKATWRIVRQFVPDLLKMHLVERLGGVPDLRLETAPSRIAEWAAEPWEEELRV